MLTAYIRHPDCLKPNPGELHPEHPARLRAIDDQLLASGLLSYLDCHDAPQATLEQIERVHDRAYVENLFNISPLEGELHLDPDTIMTPDTLEAALRACGAAVLATELVLRGQAINAFCAIRPPGHHAGPDYAMGFCLFNNVAVAAAHALEVFGLSRVAIADFDVHHGNGTEDIFRNDPRVMLCSSFQHPFYPYLGAESGNDHIINVPLPANTSGDAFREAIETHWKPALESFRPEMLFISAGFDAHWEDDQGQMLLNERDYRWISQFLKDMAARHCSHRLVSVLEGGYVPEALGRSVAAHMKVLMS